MISAISQLAAKAPQAGAPTANIGSGADIFLSLLTQEFQTSNGLIDPSLANLNPKQPAANAADLSKVDPNKTDLSKPDPIVAEGSTQVAGNSSIATKKLGDKDKNQSAKADDAVPAEIVTVPTIPVLPTPVPVQVQPQQQVSTDGDKTNIPADDVKKVPAALQFVGMIGGEKNNDLQINSVYKNSANQTKAAPTQNVNVTQDADSADEADNENTSAISSTADAMQADDAAPAKSKVAEGMTKSLINAAAPAMKHATIDNSFSSKDKQVAPDANLAKQAATPDVNTTSSDATNVPVNPAAAVLNTNANQATVTDNNKFTETNQVNDKGNDSAVQISSVPDAKSQDSVAAAKSAFKKDEGQLNQQDSQQAPAQTATNDSQVITNNPAFHSAVTQQIHATAAANGTTQHSQVNAKTNLPSNNLQSASQQIASAAAHDSTLPVGSGPLQSAKLVERLGQAELRVGVQVGDMGGVDIRTSMAHNQLTAEISVEHSELGHMLAANLPSLQNKLSEHQIQTANITFQNQMSGNSSQSEQRSRQGNSSQPQTPIERIPYGEAESFSRMSASSSESVETNAGLDIHI